MKVKLGLSKQNRFTVWESGCWRPERSNGFSFVAAAADASPLEAIYDKEQTVPDDETGALRVLKGEDHYLFFAPPGMLGVSTEVSWDRKARTHVFQIRLVEFVSFSNDGGRVTYTTRLLWTMQRLLRTAHREKEILDIVEQEFTVHNTVEYSAERKELIFAGVKKATRVMAEQTLFWGRPRVALVGPASPQLRVPIVDPSLISHKSGRFPSGGV